METAAPSSPTSTPPASPGPAPSSGAASPPAAPLRVGIVGASGYTGAELMRLLAGHPHLEVAFATGASQAGSGVAELYPSLAAAYGDLAFVPYEPDLVDDVDLVFCGLPTGHRWA